MRFRIFCGACLGAFLFAFAIGCGVAPPATGTQRQAVTTGDTPPCPPPGCWTDCTACTGVAICDWSCGQKNGCGIKLDPCPDDADTDCEPGKMFDRRFCECVPRNYCGKDQAGDDVICAADERCCIDTMTCLSKTLACRIPRTRFVCVDGAAQPL